MPGMRPRVVKIELQETSPPPGNKGGAVSGAGPCALATEAPSSGRNDRTTRANGPMKYGFRILTNASSSSNGYAEAHQCFKLGADWRTDYAKWQWGWRVAGWRRVAT